MMQFQADERQSVASSHCSLHGNIMLWLKTIKMRWSEFTNTRNAKKLAGMICVSCKPCHKSKLKVFVQIHVFHSVDKLMAQCQKPWINPGFMTASQNQVYDGL